MRCLIIDDHPLLRLGMLHLLERDFPGVSVVEADTLTEGLAQLREQPVDLVLLDLHLPDAEGIEGAARMVRAAGKTPVLVVSQGDESALAARLLKLGVRGFLPKVQAPQRFCDAVRQVLAGHRYVTPEQADRLVALLDKGSDPDDALHEGLSLQEFRVMQLIAAGHPPARIAEAMHLSVKTVGSYRARIFQKTGWQSNAELTKYCVAHGLTEAATG